MGYATFSKLSSRFFSLTSMPSRAVNNKGKRKKREEAHPFASEEIEESPSPAPKKVRWNGDEEEEDSTPEPAADKVIRLGWVKSHILDLLDGV